MIVAVTGSSGFIGKKLVIELLSKGHEVLKLDISEGINILDWKQLQNIRKFDVMVHLAGKTFVPDSFKDPRDFLSCNFQLTLNSIELCRKLNAKIIYISSYVYGNPLYLPIDEKHQINETNAYAQSKMLGEQLCSYYNKLFRVPVIIARPFNIYGIGQSENFLIPKIIKLANQKQKVTLTDSRPKRDFLYIDDFVYAIYKMIISQFDKLEIFNLGSGESYSVKQVVDIICSYFPQMEVEYTNVVRENEIVDCYSDNSKAARLINWIPNVKLEKGLELMLNS